MGLKADVKCLVNNSRSPGLTPTKIPDEPYVCFKFPPPSIPTLSEASTQTNASFLTTLTSMSRPITSKNLPMFNEPSCTRIAPRKSQESKVSSNPSQRHFRISTTIIKNFLTSLEQRRITDPGIKSLLRSRK